MYQLEYYLQYQLLYLILNLKLLLWLKDMPTHQWLLKLSCSPHTFSNNILLNNYYINSLKINYPTIIRIVKKLIINSRKYNKDINWFIKRINKNLIIHSKLTNKFT